jgi:DNA-binding LacI/PurR family transcriptional regulator
MVTIKDVAKLSGVSIKTVSRVVNNLSEVSPETRQKVQQAISTLGYQPNTMARSLVKGRTNTVGVIIPHSAEYIFDHPFFTEVLRGIAEVLSANSYNLLLFLAYDKIPYAQLYYQRQVDGLILMSIPAGDANLRGIHESGVPFVCTCRLTEDDRITNVVDADFTDGVEQGMEHLISLGHRRIALLPGPMSLISVQLRRRGYQNALGKHGILELDGYILEGEFSSESGHALAIKAMQQPNPPTALVCGDDLIAFGAIQALKELGYRVPEDVSVIGFDDINLARFSSPPLTTIRQDTYRKGRIAAECLVMLMHNNNMLPPQQIILNTALVIRTSTATAPTGNQ